MLRRLTTRRSSPKDEPIDESASAGSVGGPAAAQRGLSFGDVLIASAAATVVALVVRLLLNVPTPAELFGDRITVLLPLPLFSTLLNVFGPAAKHLFFVALLLGEWLCMSLAGLAYLRLRAMLSRRGLLASHQQLDLRDLVALPLWLWVLSAAILAPILGGGVFGAALAGGMGTVLVSQLAPDVAFAVLLLRLALRASPVVASAREPGTASAEMSRRRLLRQGASALAIVAGGALAWEAFSSGLASLFGLSRTQVAHIDVSAAPAQILPPPTPTYGLWTPVNGQTPEVTSAKDFYYVSKNLVGDPRIASNSWQLQITGLINSPYSLSYSDLQALPRVEQYHTLECISNDVGGNLMSNARFTGVRLADVLNHAGIRAGASELIFHAADGYSDSLHLSQALSPDALIVYLINGGPLPQPHGFPARLLIPGLYGMKNGKWLTSLELGSGGYTGYWEQQGWTREARIKMTSRIDTPHDGDLLALRPTYIAGVAYSGNRGIARVDISTDSGQTWQTATLRRPLGSLTWVLWEYPWMPQAGHHELVVRAIDLMGTVQSPAYSAPLPDGASGYHAVNVTIG